MKLSQEELNARCDAELDKYMAMGEREAMIDISCHLQGWVGSTLLRGYKMEYAMHKMLEMLEMTLQAQEAEDPETVSEFAKTWRLRR